MMIEGYLDEAKRPTVKITLNGKTTTLALNAIIDTKFDGDLCLPIEVAVQLGLEPVEVIEIKKADEEIEKKLLFAGQLDWFREELDVDIILHNSSDVLLGTRPLKNCQVSIDFLENTVKIDKMM